MISTGRSKPETMMVYTCHVFRLWSGTPIHDREMCRIQVGRNGVVGFCIAFLLENPLYAFRLDCSQYCRKPTETPSLCLAKIKPFPSPSIPSPSVPCLHGCS